MAQTADWVETRNVLGHEFDARVAHRRDKTNAADNTAVGTRQDATNGIAVGDSIEAIVTVFFLGPVLLAVAPVYLLSEGAASDDKTASEHSGSGQRAQSFVGKIHPGITTSDDMRSLMGRPAFIYSWVGGKVWAYSYSHDFAKIYIGTAVGIVMWKEISGVALSHE